MGLLENVAQVGENELSTKSLKSAGSRMSYAIAQRAGVNESRRSAGWKKGRGGPFPIAATCALLPLSVGVFHGIGCFCENLKQHHFQRNEVSLDHGTGAASAQSIHQPLPPPMIHSRRGNIVALPTDWTMHRMGHHILQLILRPCATPKAGSELHCRSRVMAISRLLSYLEKSIQECACLRKSYS